MNIPGINPGPPPLPALPVHLQQEVFTHTSYTSPTCPNSYDRLAFRGVSVLNVIVTRILLAVPRRLNIGQLTEIRNIFIATGKVEEWGMKYHLAERLSVARHMWPISEQLQPSYAKDLFYAYIGALDVLSQQDFFERGDGNEFEDIVGGFIGQLVGCELENLLSRCGFDENDGWDRDACRKLNQRLIQDGVELPIWLSKDSGVKVAPRFSVKCQIRGRIVAGAGGRTLREAKGRAAGLVLRNDERFFNNLRNMRHAG
jgi:dsRNA-specific ribonuclease